MKAWRWWAALMAVKLAAQLWILYGVGLRVLCADDYLRVSIAGQIADKWRWFPDPIFLPGFFWLYSIPFKFGLSVQGGSIGLTILLSAGTAALLFEFLKRNGVGSLVAFLGTLMITTQPLSLWLNGVPLAETSAFFFLFLGLSLLGRGGLLSQVLGAFSIGFATLFRYEFWPIALAIAVIQLMSLDRPSKNRWLTSVIPLWGMILVVLWRVSDRDPLGPALFVYEEVSGAILKEVNAHRILWGLFAFFPVSLLMIVLFFARLSRLFSFGRDSRTICVAAMAGIFSCLFFFAIGYYPVTFPSRLLYAPLVFVAVGALLGVHQVIERASFWTKGFVFLATFALSVALACSPQVEVAPETLRVALKLKSADRPVWILKRDLGWTSLWGLTNGEPNLHFFSSSLMERVTKADPDSCILAVSKSGDSPLLSQFSVPWNREWRDGKYSLWCVLKKT